MATAASKLLTLSHRFLSSSYLHFSSSSHLRLPFEPPSFRRFCSTAAAVSDAASPVAPAQHPWPEWDSFIEKLRNKGYFSLSPAADEADAGAEDGAVLAYSTAEQNRVKNACLKFARERFDLIRSLPKEDIKAVVACGCPNIFRKPVNSSKKLRAFLELDEADVCGGCKLRATCDKAFLVPKHEEGDARTVDVVRILMTYATEMDSLLAIDSIPLSAQDSARKLLSELIKLSDTIIDPSLPKPTFNSPSTKENSSKAIKGSSKLATKDLNKPEAEMRRGDWLCPNCGFLNFAKNIRCLECEADRPEKLEIVQSMKPGDWNCPQCQFMNFARNIQCLKCNESRPPKQLQPGEWECPSCDFVNFSRNRVCKKCNHDRPDEDNNPFENHIWRKPTDDSGRRKFNFGDRDDDMSRKLPRDRKSTRGGIVSYRDNDRRITSRNQINKKGSRDGDVEDDDEDEYEDDVDEDWGDRVNMTEAGRQVRKPASARGRASGFIDNSDYRKYGEMKRFNDDDDDDMPGWRTAKKKNVSRNPSGFMEKESYDGLKKKKQPYRMSNFNTYDDKRDRGGGMQGKSKKFSEVSASDFDFSDD